MTAGATPPAQDRGPLSFGIRFGVYTLAAFFSIVLLGEREFTAVGGLIASIVARLLALLGLCVEHQGIYLTVGGFEGEVVDQCTGLFEAGLLVAAIWAYAAPIGWKLAGTIIGFGFLFTVNLLRVTSLMLIGAYEPGWFTQAHLYVWQGILVACVAGAWLGWARRIPPLAGRQVA